MEVHKRPRGLDTLLGDLVAKRIPVRYKLTIRSTNKIAEFKPKVDTSSSKLEMHQMTPN